MRAIEARELDQCKQTYIELVLPRLGLGSHGDEQQQQHRRGDGDGGRGGHAGRYSRGGRHFSARFPLC